MLVIRLWNFLLGTLAVSLEKRSRKSTVLIELCSEILNPVRKSLIKLKMVTGT